MTQSIRSQDEIIRLMAEWESGRALLPDVVIPICNLARSQNVDEIVNLLSGDVRQCFIRFAKACAEGREWFNIGEGAGQIDCPISSQSEAALKDWYLRSIS